MKEFTFRKFADLKPTTLPKMSSFKVAFQGFSLLYYFSLWTRFLKNTFEWLLPDFCLTLLLPDFCLTLLLNTNKKKSINKENNELVENFFHILNFQFSELPYFFFFGNSIARIKEKFINSSLYVFWKLASSFWPSKCDI